MSNSEIEPEAGAEVEASEQEPLRRWGEDPLNRDLDQSQMKPGPPCTEAEAEDLTVRARRGMKEFDEAMSEIVWRQAWKALGYDSARAYMLGEFGSAVAEGQKSYSRRHILRLVRTLEFVSALQERLGSAARDINVTERELRGVPSHEAGEGFELLVGEIVEKVGDSPTGERTQEVVDDVIASHRQDLKNRADATAADESFDVPLEVGAAPREGESAPAAAASAQSEAADDEGAGDEALRAEAISQATRLADFKRAWAKIGGALPYLEQMIESASDSDLRGLEDLSEAVTDAVDEIREAREERDKELLGGD